MWMACYVVCHILATSIMPVCLYISRLRSHSATISTQDRIDRCLGYLHAKADPDCNILWSKILQRKISGIWKMWSFALWRHSTACMLHYLNICRASCFLVLAHPVCLWQRAIHLFYLFILKVGFIDICLNTTHPAYVKVCMQHAVRSQASNGRFSPTMPRTSSPRCWKLIPVEELPLKMLWNIRGFTWDISVCVVVLVENKSCHPSYSGPQSICLPYCCCPLVSLFEIYAACFSRTGIQMLPLMSLF